MEDKWIDIIRVRMVEYETVPPADLLESVQAAVKSRRKRKRWILYGAAASVALLCGISVALIPESVENPGLSALNVDDNTGKKGFSLPEEANTLHNPTAHGGRRAMTALASNMAQSTASIEIPVIQEEDETDGRQCEPDQDNESHESVVGQERLSDKDLYEESSEYTDAAVTTSSGDSRLSVGVLTSANGLGGMLNDGNTGYDPAHNSSSIPLTRMGGGVLDDALVNNSPVPRFIEIFDHKLPVRFSLDFSWTLSHDLNVGAGISYSYLRSDISYGYSDIRLSKATQNLHYLGIPINLRYTPWRFHKLGVYASMGFMAEKCIAGDIREEDEYAGKYYYAGCGDRPFQFSFNVAAGLQYSLAKSCAVFVEPGVGIYLNNGSRLRTIYSESPLTFNLNVGLRFGHP